MKKLTLYSILIGSALLGIACEDSDDLMIMDNNAATWEISPNQFQHFMSIVARTSQASDTTDILAAFSGDRLLGFTRGEIHNGQVIHLLLVYSNEPERNIGFRLYQSVEDRVIGSPDSLTFEAGTGLGSPDNPEDIRF